MLGKGVIVTDGNERATLAVARSLGRHGIPVYVGAETSSSLAGASRYCTGSFTYPSPWHDPEAYLSCLFDAISRWNVTAVFPMTDIAMELIGEHRREIEQSTALPIPSLEQYHLLSDKYHLTAWAEKHGIPIPRTIYIPDGKIDVAIEHIDRWPVVVKPGRSLLKIDGIWRKSKVMFAHDSADLRRLYHEAWFLKRPSMIQQYVAGRGEGVFGFFADGKPISLFAHRRLRERPPSGGVSVLRESIPLPEPMADYAARIIREAGWNGIAMVEFKVDSQSQIPYLMEVNGRFWGSLQLAVDAGVDFPLMLYRSVSAKAETVDRNSYRVGIRSQWWLGDLDHLLARMRKQKDEAALPPGSPSLLSTFLSLINVFDFRTKNEVFRISDVKPGLLELGLYSYGMINAIGRKVNQRFRNGSRALSTTLLDTGLIFGSHRKSIKERFPSNVTNVLVLCKGNICRSPFAEKWLTKAAGQRRLNVQIRSAGLEAISGLEAYPMAKTVSPKFGVNLNDHRAEKVSDELIEWADLILVMEPAQTRELIGLFPIAKKKTFLLGHFPQKKPSTEIKDPYGGTAGDFDECFAIIVSACEGFLSHV